MSGSSCTHLGLAQVMEVINTENHSQAHLWVITSNKWTYNSKTSNLQLRVMQHPRYRNDPGGLPPTAHLVSIYSK